MAIQEVPGPVAVAAPLPRRERAVNHEEVKHVGRWRVVRFLGAGGFSWVFEVLDENLGRRCALKMLRPEAGEGEQYRRFRKEAELLASFNDPHIVTIFDRGQDERTGCHFYVMELFTGRDLRKVIEDEGPLDWERAADLFAGVLQGLGLLHSHEPGRIIHRDIKPSNIQLTAEGQAKLFDLGIARVQRATPPANADETRSTADEARLTEFNAFIGTVRYASPEQIKLKEISPASDVFSVGLCFFEALTGVHPYEDLPGVTTSGHTYASVLEFYALAVRDGKRFRLGYKDKKVPLAIREVIAKAVNLDPQKRFRDANEMRAALIRAVDEGRTGRKERRIRPGPRLLGGVFAFALLVGAGFYLVRILPHPLANLHTPGVQPDQPAKQNPRSAPADTQVSAPTSEQISHRLAALELRRKVEGTPPSAFTPNDLSEFRAALDAAEGAWRESSWDSADAAYTRASRLGEESLAQATQKLRSALGAARDSAALAGAQESAPKDFRRAETLAKEASQGGPESGSHLGQAIAAYGAAGDAASRALAEARSAEKSASKRVESACTAPTSASAAACVKSRQLLASGTDALRSKNAIAANQAFGEAERAVAALPAPVLTLDRVDAADLKVGGSRTIRAHAKSADGIPASIHFELTDPGGKRETTSGGELIFRPSIPGNYRLVVTATDARGGSAAQTQIFRVGEPPQGSSVAGSVGSNPAPGALASPSRQVLGEYSQAIKSCDRETLATLVPRAVSQSIGESCDRYAYLDATIAYVSEEPGAKGTTVHFTQAIRGITQDGRSEVIGEGKMKATVVQGGGGWRILELGREP